MKTSNNVIHYASKQDYLNRTPSKGLKNALPKGAGEQVAKEKVKDTVKENVKEKAKEDVTDKIKDKVTETKEAGKHLLSQAGSALARGVGEGVLKTIGITPPSISINPEVTEVKTVANETVTRVNKPGIFFIKGMSLNPFADEDKGLAGMSKNIPTSEVFGWNDTDEIIKAINSRPHSQPIVLVGHGMGGDTAVDVVNQMNSVEHGFRRIDLLVTMDSIGTDNDIIPQNVRENYNLISDQDTLFNDGPNVARKKNQTKVENQLLEIGHNEMEVDPEVQFLVYEKINRTLMNAVALKKIKSNLNEQLMNSHRLSSRATKLFH